MLFVITMGNRPNAAFATANVALPVAYIVGTLAAAKNK